MGYALPYRFDDRGWLQFDRLCAALLDLDSVAWAEREFGRVGLVADGVVPPAGSARLAAPTLVIVAWLRRDAFRSRRLPLLLATELERAPDRMVGSVLVITNTEEPADDVPVTLVQIGPQRLSELVDADPQLRLRVPSVLG